MVEVKTIVASELTVGELARRAGVSVAAIHFYERKGLISAIRTSGNQRRFARANLRRVALIQVAKHVGMPLSELRNIFGALPDNRTPNHRDWQRIAKAWQQDISKRIKELEALSANLTGCIGCGCLSLNRCKLFNKNDKLADKGNGPILLRQKF